jgi:uncharacterized LabA/DUF88 family protein
MNLVESERTAVFIDGTNLYSASRSLSFDVDYRNLLSYFSEKTNLVRMHYYTALADDDPDVHNPLKPLTDWLSYNGYTVVTKRAREFTDNDGKRRLKGTNVSIMLAVDALELAPRIDHMVIFSGDADLAYFVNAIKKAGVKVTIVSSFQSTPPLVADELRRAGDEFIELKDLSNEPLESNEDLCIRKPSKHLREAFR